MIYFEKNVALKNGVLWNGLSDVLHASKIYSVCVKIWKFSVWISCIPLNFLALTDILFNYEIKNIAVLSDR